MPKSKHRKKHKQKLKQRKNSTKKSNRYSKDVLKAGMMGLLAGAFLNDT